MTSSWPFILQLFMWLLLIKCSLYDFYNMICISGMFTWPRIRIHLNILQKMKLDLKYCRSLWVEKYKQTSWIVVYDGLTLCWCCLCAGVVSTELYVNKIPTDATVCRYLFTAKLLYMFRVSQHPSSGVLKTVPASSGTGHTTCTGGCGYSF